MDRFQVFKIKLPMYRIYLKFSQPYGYNVCFRFF